MTTAPEPRAALDYAVDDHALAIVGDQHHGGVLAGVAHGGHQALGDLAIDGTAFLEIDAQQLLAAGDEAGS